MSDDARVPWRSERWVPALLAAAIVSVFQPVASAVFASSDDYAFLEAFTREGTVLPQVAGDARPLMGLLWDAVARAFVHDVPGMRAFRVFFLAYAWVAACLVWACLRGSGLSARFAAALAVVYATSAQQVDFAPLSPSHCVPLAGALVAAAFLAAERTRAGWYAAAVAMLLASLCIYQVLVFLWVLPCAAHAWARPSPHRERLRALASRVVVPAVACTLYALAFASLGPLGLVPNAGARAGLTSRPLLKAAWFAVFPLRDALNVQWMPPRDPFLEAYAGSRAPPGPEMLRLFLAQPATWVALVVGVAMVAGLWLALEGTRRERAVQLVLALLLLPAALFPNMVIESLWAPLRTQVVLVALVHLYLLLGARAAWRRWGTGLPAWTPRIALAAWALAGVASSRSIVDGFIVQPLGCEWATVLRDTAALGPVDEVAVRRARADAFAGAGVRYELGRPASAAPWAGQAMVSAARGALGMPPATTVRVLDGSADAGGAPVLELGCRRPR